MAQKPILLAIDTATRFAGVAIYDGSLVLAESYWQSQNNHSVELMPAVTKMLEQQGLAASDLAVVGVALGPGSFTGLRISLSVAKGLAQALKIPIIGIPTLDILAFQHAGQRRPIWAVIQAGRGRLCAARYERRRGRWRRRGELHLTALDGLIALLTGRCLVCGELLGEQCDHIAQQTDQDVVFATPSLAMRRPACLAELAWRRFERDEWDDLATLAPIYLHTMKT